MERNAHHTMQSFHIYGIYNFDVLLGLSGRKFPLPVTCEKIRQ